ncbi:S8 family serine peptidase [Cohnella sp. CFH 77786]|uniref:S8 family peptidase n=1 Tax=Cohnella sp. CFH 77786 TaxID=2662265 RepID=UPI001C60EE36|nr:S8 family peptidase [Cohnella sp. CFH 77786]MBW5446717.1 S8 family serine peptidase [Cohnella sp. CFH 77786]
MIKIEELLALTAKRTTAARTERLIVVFKRGGAYRRSVKHLLAAGVKPVRMSAARRMICYHAAKKGQHALLKSHPDVAYVERDIRVKAHAAPAAGKVRSAADCPPTAPWNVCRVKSPPLWPLTRGTGVRVGVLDTGIARHPDLTIAGGVNTLGGTSFHDDNGHGTHVAGIIAATGRRGLSGNAPGVLLYAVKVLNESGSGFVSDIVEGIDWCLANGIRILNMSFGLPGDSLALREAIRRARRRGAIIVASAGNGGAKSGVLDAPARYPETIAVTALAKNNRAASFSSRGPGIAVGAPGVHILSTWPGGTYRRLSGTSMSAPHVAGSAALLRSLAPKLTASAFASRIKSAALRIPGGVTAVGSGLLQTSDSASGLASLKYSPKKA